MAVVRTCTVHCASPLPASFFPLILPEDVLEGGELAGLGPKSLQRGLAAPAAESAWKYQPAGERLCLKTLLLRKPTAEQDRLTNRQ